MARVNIDAGFWGGYFTFQDDEVETDKNNDSVVGGAVDIGFATSDKSRGILSLDYEHTLDDMGDTDQTNFYRQIAYAQSFVVSDGSWVVRPYIGVGDSKDFGDSDDAASTDYSFYGLGISKRLEAVNFDVQVGRVDSSDYDGETIDHGFFTGVTMD